MRIITFVTFTIFPIFILLSSCSLAPHKIVEVSPLLDKLDLTKWTPWEFKYRMSLNGIHTIDTRGIQVKNEGVILKNVGTKNIESPWVVLNNKRDWFNIDRIVYSAIGEEIDPKKKAFKIWKFVLNNRYHDAPAEGGAEIHDPVKYLNIYGYGICDDSARNAGVLFIRAGLKARTWGLSGHVIPEVYYNDDWHILDPDHGVFYPELDKITLASVKDCENDGRIVRRISGTRIEKLYTSSDNNYSSDYFLKKFHDMSMILRPNESCERYFSNIGKHHDYYDNNKPRYDYFYGNGKIIYHPDLTSSDFLGGFEVSENIRLPNTSNSPLVQVKNPALPGTLVCKMESPYVFVGGEIYIKLETSTKENSLKVEFSKDDWKWKEVQGAINKTDGKRFYDIDPYIATNKRSACYKFWVKVILNNDNSNVGLNDLKITADIQYAPKSLPIIGSNRINKSSIKMNTADSELEITHLCKLRKGYFVSNKTMITSHENNCLINTTSPVFKWKLEKSNNEVVLSQVIISWDKEGVLPVSPTLSKFLKDGSCNWKVPKGWLINGKKYYFSVRSKTNTGSWSRWSFPLGFIISNSEKMK